MVPIASTSPVRVPAVSTAPEAWSAPTAPSARSPWVGQTVRGRFRIMQALGSGNASTVFRGVSTPDNEPVAIRVFDQTLSTQPGFEAGFRKTVEAWAAVEHPHVVRVLDHGFASTGEALLITEFVDSGTLHDLIKRAGAVGEAGTIRCARQLAKALTAAHLVGTVHGHINPRNVFLGKDKTVLELRLADFGLLQLAQFEPDHDDSRGMPSSGVISASDWMVIGDPNFSAPETLLAQDVSESSDVYCLTALLFTLLTGHPPFESHTRLETMNRQLHEPPPAVFLFGAECHVALEALLRRGLEKDPEKRIRSMAELDELLDDLEQRVARRNAEQPSLVSPFPLPRANDSRPKTDPRAQDILSADGPPALEWRDRLPVAQTFAAARERSVRVATAAVDVIRSGVWRQPDWRAAARSKLVRLQDSVSDRLSQLRAEAADDPKATARLWAILGGVAALGFMAAMLVHSLVSLGAPGPAQATASEAAPPVEARAPSLPPPPQLKTKAASLAPVPSTEDAEPPPPGAAPSPKPAPAAPTAAPAPVLTAPAAPSTTRVVLESTPPGAEVWMGSRRVATTPATIELPPADELRVFEFRREGLIGSFEEAVVQGEEVRVSARLRPRPPVETAPPPPGYKGNPFD